MLLPFTGAVGRVRWLVVIATLLLAVGGRGEGRGARAALSEDASRRRVGGRRQAGMGGEGGGVARRDGRQAGGGFGGDPDRGAE